jgi:hypothetical protein
MNLSELGDKVLNFTMQLTVLQYQTLYCTGKNDLTRSAAHSNRFFGRHSTGNFARGYYELLWTACEHWYYVVNCTWWLWSMGTWGNGKYVGIGNGMGMLLET